MRQDQSTQLKGGVVAAFGLARGAALAESLIKTNSNSVLSLDTLAAAALLCGESVITIGFAAAALEYAFQRQLIRPLGSSGSDTS